MKKERIYIDTSVIGGCFDAEFAVWSNGLFRNFREGLFVPILSELVAAEIEDAPRIVRERFLEFLKINPNVLGITDESLDLAKSYLMHQILPVKFHDDCLHIALAAVAGVDILVSWNFKHIVRFDKIRLFNAVNMEKGYRTLQIHSPREVTTYGQE